MLRLPLLLFALGCNAASGNGESGRTQACSAQIEFAPVLVSNPDTVVTFTCDHASSLQLIQAAGRQTRLPIGIVLGNDPTILSRTMRSFSLAKLDAKSTLLEAIAGTGYSLNESNGTFVLIAGDLTSRQRQVLDHVYPDFKAGLDQTMVELGVQLTMWMQAEIDHVPGFGGSILYSLNDERFTFAATSPSTTEEIANGIVSMGSKGIWILRADAFQRPEGVTDAVKIEPYQHYSNMASSDR
jgi:hypothetical protein